jgi:hypothetical protein
MLKRFNDKEAGSRQAERPRSPQRSHSANMARKGLGWIPWQAVVSRLARGAGFVDPAVVLRRLRSFAQPSEVGEPVELLRAGAMFHARGLINTRAIQFNLDWVWPFWVDQQFNPHSEAFIPRAFSFSHINLTHRNWTAVGLPDVPHYPLVDPRGLVTPLFDGWSLDFWLVGDGAPLLPSKCARVEQSLDIGENISVHTRLGDGARGLNMKTSMERDEHGTWCVVRVIPTSPQGERLVVAVRPYNPEGVSFIDSVRRVEERAWLINGLDTVQFSRAPHGTAMSCYKDGDVLHALNNGEKPQEIDCAVGMATAAAMFSGQEPVEVRVRVEPSDSGSVQSVGTTSLWRDELAGCARLSIPDERWQQLSDAALATVILHSPGEVFPGPYTYRRFWYRDAAFILNALLTWGGRERTRRALELFPRGQLRDGYFRSQEGEWDSNGEVLWMFDRYCSLTGEPLPEEWREGVERGARWILRKRMSAGSAHPGLLPAGFSAEHLGPNDYYYWDNFWAVAGLRAATRLLPKSETHDLSAAADEYWRVISQSIARALDRTGGAIPAAPDRRMDSGAVGSLIADYPLQLFPPGDAGVLKTVEWLLAHSLVGGGFFQNMIHSGINAYLTLHVAQVLLRAGDARAHSLIDVVAALASPTGQWPEAIHPRTLGGCMGDGQHVWAAAEWLIMMRNLFVREEGDALVIGAGVREEWLRAGKPFGLERTLTPAGEVTVLFTPRSPEDCDLHIEANWHASAPRLEVRVPGFTITPESAHDFRLRRSP